jgi:hypothetical protein
MYCKIQNNMTTSTSPQITHHQEIALAQLGQIAKRLEKNYHVDNSLRENVQGWALAIVDALNFSAKLQNNQEKKSKIYKDKSLAVAAATTLGCEIGLGLDESQKQVLYMYAPGIGVVSVHTEYLDEVPAAMPWQHDWAALRRQRWSIAALRNKAIRDLLEEYTSPYSSTRDSAEFQRKANALEPYYPYADYEY